MQAKSSSLPIWLLWDKNLKIKKGFSKVIRETGNNEDCKLENKPSIAIFFNGKRYKKGMEI